MSVSAFPKILYYSFVTYSCFKRKKRGEQSQVIKAAIKVPSNIFLEFLKEQMHSHLCLQYIHNGIIKKSVVQHICLLLYVCASWHPAHGQRKTFLSRAFGLCGRREQPFVPQADRRRVHNCPPQTQLYTQT